jgi:ABC-type Fe3+/spermidine/putrescine transport system ATPase subunit
MLTINNISFSYEAKTVLKNIDFAVAKNSITAIIGESGCGKSTLLKLIYGLHDLNQGEIFFNNKAVLGPKFNLVPGVTEMKYLAQNFDLMPFITVAENIGKFLSNIDGTKKQARILELLNMIDMLEFAHTKAKYLSGGQQQRVALARVLALEPEFLLLDEAFGQIDALKKNELQRNLFTYLQEKKIGCLFATHDTADALAYAQETIVMRAGTILIKDKTKNVYEKPLNHYVASLFGDVSAISKSILYANGDSNEKILVYPHQLKLTKSRGFKAIVSDCYYKGSHYLIKAVVENETVFFKHNSNLQVGKSVLLSFKV